MDLKMADFLADGDLIDFGPLPEDINLLLQEGVAAYYDDRDSADALFQRALDLDPSQLPTYFCLYKIHTYQRNLDDALRFATAGLTEAGRQCRLTADWRDWTAENAHWANLGAARFALYTLKALAFIHLRRNEAEQAHALLNKLCQLDPQDSVGGRVVADLAARVSG